MLSHVKDIGFSTLLHLKRKVFTDLACDFIAKFLKLNIACHCLNFRIRLFYTYLFNLYASNFILQCDNTFLFHIFQLFPSLQVLRYFDYVFTGVFTFEMVIKVSEKGSLFLSQLEDSGQFHIHRVLKKMDLPNKFSRMARLIKIQHFWEQFLLWRFSSFSAL